MQPALVKIDVVAATLGVGVRHIEAMVDGGDLITRGIVWVFDFANDRDRATRRELRFWWPEAQLRAQADSTKQFKYASWELDWVIAQILPARRKTFQAGEVDQLFQIRHNTRLDFGRELNGNLKNGANTYERTNLSSFLARRWLGAVSSRLKFSPDNVATSHPKPEGSRETPRGVATVNRPDRSRLAVTPAKTPSTKSAAHIPASPATTMQRRKSGNLPAPASLTGAEIFHMEQK